MCCIFIPLSGLNVGCFYALSTLLNRMVIHHYPVSVSNPHGPLMLAVVQRWLPKECVRNTMPQHLWLTLEQADWLTEDHWFLQFFTPPHAKVGER